MRMTEFFRDPAVRLSHVACALILFDARAREYFAFRPEAVRAFVLADLRELAFVMLAGEPSASDLLARLRNRLPHLVPTLQTIAQIDGDAMREWQSMDRGYAKLCAAIRVEYDQQSTEPAAPIARPRTKKRVANWERALERASGE